MKPDFGDSEMIADRVVERLTIGKSCNIINRDAILAILPSFADRGIYPVEIFKRLGIDRPTASQRASLSRSLRRLWSRDLIQLWKAQCYMVGKGVAWSLPEEVLDR